MNEVFVKTNVERHYQWRAVGNEGEILQSFVTKAHSRKAGLMFICKPMRCVRPLHARVTVKHRFGAAEDLPRRRRQTPCRARSSH
ncbi:DDE-type integrase/transposase/recombinase [Tropicimonas sp. TH_r6]|uniref:DDE-type integrase/transposase/recombinase n=1 Tax=Tropicimonas sp. TH_r6 TaxID=3082085 RepID=UPI003985D1CF